jgi:hypothetical protein
LRGQVLVALDQRRYPQLSLSDGRRIGRGLLNWAPVLREMEELELRDVLEHLAKLSPPRSDKVEE